jgi:hypothetical protein
MGLSGERRMSFAKDGLQFARNLVSRDDLRYLSDSIAARVRESRAGDGDGANPGAYCIHSPEGGTHLLAKLAPKLVELIGSPLVPTYSYAQVYRRGGFLPLHVDGPQCEITATITIDFDADAIWPLFILSEPPLTVKLLRGDAIIFDATRFLHCRKAFDGKMWTQLTLHYVHDRERGVTTVA